MQKRAAALFLAVFCLPIFGQDPSPLRPKSGKVEIFKESDLKPGMKGYAWTVLAGNEPEPIPVEIVGILKNQWGPKQDIIIGKMGGKAIRTNVAGGMSGSPVYIDGKLVGAVALRLSVFSPDAICGITPIELMLEVNEFDQSRPSEARTPDKALPRASVSLPPGMLSQVVSAGGSGSFPQSPIMIPIDTPLNFSGFQENVLREFGPLFQQMGMTVAAGGASSTLRDAKPAPGWQNSLQPGDAVTGVLVTGDMSVSGMCTVTYNDGKHVLLCGHSFFNLGPIDMPMAKGEVLMTLASQFQPNKFGNATEVVGALHQDRHSAVMGELGATAPMVPVSVKIRSFGENNSIRSQRDLHFSVFVQQKWTPYLMMLTLFNSVSSLNDFADEATYRLSGKIEFDGLPNLSLSTMLAPGEAPVPAPMQLAGWWGDRFNRLFLNSVRTPKLKSVDATIDLLPDRRVATIENAWVANSEVDAGSELPIKVFLRPYRGERIERAFTVKIPAGLSRGEHRILLSDSDTLNRMQSTAGLVDRFLDIPQTVSLLNQERTNNQLYVSLIESRPTVYYEDKALPSLPASIMNVMQTGRTASRHFLSSPESAIEQGSIPFDLVVNGSYSLKFTVR
jgi:SpoIVB peptidase S55